MKKSNILKATLMLGVLTAASSCTEEKIYGIDPNGVPQASDYNIKVEVDQEINRVALTLTDKNGNDAKGVYPIWKVYTKESPSPSTRLTYTDIVTIAGDYDVEVQVANHNGISDGVQTATFHIDNTMVDFSPYVKFLTDNESKTWQIAANTQGHLGCGPSGTEGLEWWSAAPYDKKDWGVYDNRMIFTDNGGNGEGEYTYDPGASGTIYVNTGITDLSPYSEYNTNDGNDYCAPAEVQNTTFTLTPEGTELYLVFPEGTLLGYLPNVEAYTNPKFKVNDMNKNVIDLTIDEGTIAWRYLLQPEGADAGDKPFEGYKYDSEFNLWKDAELSLESTYMADDNWGVIAEIDVDITNPKISFHTPAGLGSTQWQGQVHIATNIEMSADKTYDFSIGISAPVDTKVTVKPHKSEGDDKDNVFLTAETVNFDAGGSYYYVSDVPGWDGGVTLTLDVAGYPDTEFTVTNIVIKDHANDDGTVLPGTNDGNEGSGNASWVDVNSDANLWYTANVEEEPDMWTADDNWGTIDNPDVTKNGNDWTLVYNTAPGSTQWQAQFKINSDLVISADKVYDYRVTINPTNDIENVTVKSTDRNDDGAFWSDARHNVVAYEDNVIELVGATGVDMDPIQLVFDFAGVPAGTTVTIKDIIIQEHIDGPAAGGDGGSVTWVAVDSADNLYLPAVLSDMEAWTADDSWSPIASPDINQNGNNYFELVYSETPGSSQWQAQFQYKTDLVFPEDQAYDFRVTIYPTCDIAATVKPCDAIDEDNIYWSAERHDIAAYEDNVIELVNVKAPISQFKMAYDFAGVQAGDKIIIKDIIIQEHK